LASEPRVTASIQTSGWRKVWFRLFLVFLPVLALAGVEGVLRLVGTGYPTRFFIRARQNGREVLIDNPQYGWRFMPPRLARNPQPMVMPAQKAPGTCRIFVFGESAALGDPEPAYGFSRILQILLEARYPQRRFEVVNLAMTAINSHVIRAIARESERQHGDIWLIYMGNNEVIGPFGPAGTFGGAGSSLPLIRASLALRTTRIGQLMEAGLESLARRGSEPAFWGGMEMFLADQIRDDDPRMRTVEDHFRSNLSDILAAGVRSGARLVVSTVVSNLKDCPPFGSAHPASLPKNRLAAWQSAFDKGCALEIGGHWGEALASYGEAEQIDPSYAELQFRMGRCCWETGQYAEAKRRFEAARDADTLRFRADSRLNKIIAQTAGRRESEGIYLVDAERRFAEASPHGIVGDQFLYEHVHFNFEGNYFLAEIMADGVARFLNPSRQAQGGAAWLPMQECAARLAFTEWDRERLLERVRERLSHPPFTAQLGSAARDQQLRRQIAELEPVTQPAMLSRWLAIYRQALDRAPSDWYLHNQYGKLLDAFGDTGGAATQWRAALAVTPQNAVVQYELGRALNHGSDRTEAIRHLTEALRHTPFFPEALNSLGIAYGGSHQLDRACRCFKQALALRPDFADAQARWGVVLAAEGQPYQARSHYQAALGIDSNSLPANIGLARLLASEGKPEEAARQYARAFALESQDPKVQYRSGEKALSMGNLVEALAHFALAVQLKPDFTEASRQLELVKSRLSSAGLLQR
jgi:tetratricopeptide (TPR) repeat protein